MKSPENGHWKPPEARDTLPATEGAKRAATSGLDTERLIEILTDQVCDQITESLEAVGRAIERRIILRVLGKTGGNQTEAAKLLGLRRTTLSYRMKCLGISSKRARRWAMDQAFKVNPLAELFQRLRAECIRKATEILSEGQKDYYQDRQAAERIKMVYATAFQPVRRCLRARVAYALDHVRPGDLALDLGCGYGHTIQPIVSKSGFVVGIDRAASSLAPDRSYLRSVKNFLLMEMDAAGLAFLDNSFEAVICIQNRIFAFHLDPARLFEQSIRAAKSGGMVLFSTYQKKFWPYRLKWFRKQASERFLGANGKAKTGDGIIVCRGGFRATTFYAARFRSLAAAFPVSIEIVGIEESSLFCVMKK